MFDNMQKRAINVQVRNGEFQIEWTKKGRELQMILIKVVNCENNNSTNQN